MEGTQVYAHNGDARRLGRCIGTGGQGSVYQIEGSERNVVKIFKQNYLAKSRPQLKQRIRDQISLASNFRDKRVSWPQIDVFDATNDWIGYAMRKADGFELRRLAHPKLYTKYFPNLNREQIVVALLSLIDTLEFLHNSGIIVGDLNLGNVLCDGEYKSYLIDADSYQFTASGRFYSCPVAALVMTPPEFHLKTFSDKPRTIESDLFSLAVIVFQVLMLGQHPYSSVGGEDPVENIARGHFAYAHKNGERGEDGNIPPGPWFIIWSHLSFKMKSLMIKTFKDGVHKPSERASLSDWRSALQAYRSDLKKGYLDNAVKPEKPKQRRFEIK